MFACGVGLHVNPHIDIHNLSPDFAVCGIYSVKGAVAEYDIVDSVAFAPYIERIAGLYVDSPNFVVFKPAIFYCDIAAQVESRPGFIIMEIAVPQNHIAGVVFPIK